MIERFDTASLPETDTLSDIAEEHLIDPGVERLENLHLYGAELYRQTLYREGQQWMFGSAPLMFTRDGMEIHLALSNKYGRHDEVDIHFRPERKGIRLCNRTPDLATDLILSSLISLQDFCLLVEAGYIRKPKLIRGSTNRRMAMVSKRAGFRVDRDSDTFKCRAEYDDLERAVLCSKAQDRIDFLTNRIMKSTPQLDRI